MLLNSISALTAFPSEVISIDVNELSPSLSNSRVGIHFIDSYYDYDDDKYKWDNFPLTTSEGQSLSAPTQYMNIPGDFPIIYTVSGYTDHLDLVFSGGASAISIYPSRPYPHITKISNNIISISANLAPLTAFDQYTDTQTYRRLMSNTSPLSSFGNTLSLVGAFKTAIKKDFKAGEVRTQTTLSQRTVQVPLTPTRPRKGTGSFNASERIIKESMMTKIIISSPSIDAFQATIDENDGTVNDVIGFPYFLYWDGTQSIHSNTQSNRLFGAVFAYPDYEGNIYTLDEKIKPGYIPDLAAWTSQSPSIGDAFIRLYDKSTNQTKFREELYLAIHPRLYRANSIELDDGDGDPLTKIYYPLSATSIYLPRGTDINVWYETSAFTTINEISSNSISNVHTFSSFRPPYLNGYMFTATTPRGTQRAFTVNYSPNTVVETDAISAISYKTTMIDNYYQSEFDIDPNDNGLISRFSIDFADDTLSAINRASGAVYQANEWFPTSATIWFENDGSARNYLVSFETSSIYDSRYYQPNVPMILNRDKATIGVREINRGSTTSQIQGTVFPEDNINLNFRWSVDPPENVMLYDANDPTRVIPMNTSVGDDSLDIIVQNLGVDSTKITLFLEDYNIEASTTWQPPTDVWANANLAVIGDIDDFNPINYGTLSAMFIRNGLLYRVPTTANIKWEDASITVPNQVEFFTISSVEQILEQATYPSTNRYSLIQTKVTTENSPVIPRANYKVNCFVFDSLYTYQASYIFSLRPYPEDSNLFSTISSSQNPNIISSEDYTNIIYNNTATVILSANIENLDIVPSDIIWNLGLTTLTGLTASFEISTISACIGLSALSALPSNGTNGRFNFFDNMCFYVLTGLNTLEYISFPQYNYLPNSELTFNNYQSKYIALSSYSACHTENILFSATPGFDEYVWSLGSSSTRTNTNTAILPLSIDNISTSNRTVVSAFNSIFIEDDPGSIYNTASSTGVGFTQHMNFVEFPNITMSLSSSTIMVDMRDIFSRIVDISIGANILDLSAGFFNLTLSSINGVFAEPIDIVGNTNVIMREFEYGDGGIFEIPENSSSIINAFIDGTAWGYVDGFDFCATPFTLSSNIISFTAFDGPDLKIWSSKNVLEKNEIIQIENTTNNTFINPFVSFSFWNGYNIQSGTLESTFSAQYNDIGTYDVSLSGYRANGDVLTATWNNFFVIDENAPYDERVNRRITDKIVLPHSYDKLKIPANSWQFAATLNDAFTKLDQNINFLNTQCFIANDDIPLYDISCFGKYRGVETWRYNFTPNLLETTPNDFKDIVFYDEYILILNGKTIEIRNNDNSWSIISKINSSTDLEEFRNPIRIQKLNDKLIILDSESNSIYVGSINFDTFEFKLTHYWGGVGAKNSRTRLNGPADLLVINDSIFVVDSDSMNIKIYNKFLNWTNNIQFDATPVAIAGFEDILYVLDINGKIRILSDLIEISSFQATPGERLTYSPNESKLYISAKDGVYVYSKNGSFINKTEKAKNIIIYENEVYNILSDRIVKNSNFLNYLSITTLTSFSNDSTTYKVHRDEPVTSFIINDSLNKLKLKLTTLSDSLTGQFIKLYNNEDQFLYSSISAKTINLNCEPSTLGLNELVTFETINREILNTLQCISSLADYIDGESIYPTTSSPFWTWEYHFVNKNQRPNLNKTPLSWDELTSAHPLYSGVTWLSIGDSTGFENSFPVGWTWEDLENGCLNALTWEEMEDGRIRAYTWEELENINQFGPPYFLFDNCV